VDLEQSGLVAEWSCRWVDLRLGGLAAGWTCSRADLEQMAGLLDEQTFEQVVRSTPLCSIDLVLRDPDARTLVGLRTNEPAKGFYFVPGGIIRKDERMADAFGRILMQETSIEAELSEARLDISAFSSTSMLPINSKSEASEPTISVMPTD
jgi:hypothetical protein